jgi:preprotein translocase subunit SecD
MLYFQQWKITLILAVCALGVILTAPNLFTAEQLSHLPSWVPHRQVALGLDLRGGSYLLYEVDMAAVERDRLNNLVDELRQELIKAKIGYSGGLAVQDDHVTVNPTDPTRRSDVKDIVAKIDPKLQVTIGETGAISIKPDPVALIAERQHAVEQSIEIVRRRVDELGTREPTIQREGEDRIVVELPGVDNPQHIIDTIGKTAKMTFQLVDENVTPEDAKEGHLPPGDEVLPLADGRGGGAIVVKKRVAVDGSTLIDASAGFKEGSVPIVNFTFDSAGARRFEEVTSNNVGKRFAIVLDKKVISAPVIKSPIPGGKGYIEGSFTVQSATDLALLLRAGALPAPLTAIEQRTVGAELGADSIRAGTLATLVGIILVVLFMIVFYGLFGVFADIALFFNLCLMLASLSLLGATLTLPGIAGIALTTGMAVDANVLIYERIREEMRGGRSLISSLQAGFERAFGTIVDSHVTTLVAGALMFFLGSGPVKGFAVTLSIGVVTSLFSAILVTRLQIVTWLRRTKPKALPI